MILLKMLFRSSFNTPVVSYIDSIVKGDNVNKGTKKNLKKIIKVKG